MIDRRALMGGIALAPLARPAFAQAWPSRPIRLVVGFPPGGTTDLAARVLIEPLTTRLGQSVVVENRPGGSGGNIGADVVAKAEPDGYTLLMQTVSSGAINFGLYGSRMPHRPEDLAAVALVVKVPNAIFVNNNLPVRNLRELVDLAKRQPGKLNIGSSGVGTSLHMTGELLKQAAGIEMTHVPFRGAGPMIQEIIAGRVEVGVDNLPSVIGHLREGRLRPLAVTTATRTPTLPDVPTTAEAGFPAVEATAWFGIAAPARTPRAIIDRVARETNAALADPAVWQKLADLGGMKPGLTPDGLSTPETFQAFITAEIAKWGEVVRRGNITVD
ncbi:Bug family tripartite tricarboxylate transporter substrate binding protein [Neoroseomonas soli]|uniref:Tripartite tricarboxylate transporter substrate binding protein n=1 Tax=Neoroseomonas soli TaxID=1081025 RepID=A0A9X9WUG0_9PROT|nr:tripartite tricarboxylate transporter substrate binding protein [Neoroseomonas soli]MBR0670789.1 tripartite tricarboxylate transporter substrate binding protein [Neoroseomonas soli]